MQTHIFLLFFFVAATLTGIHARHLSSNCTEDLNMNDEIKEIEEAGNGNFTGNSEIHIVARSIPDKKIDLSLLLAAPILDDIPILSDILPDDSDESSDSSDEDSSEEQDYCPIAILLSMFKRGADAFEDILEGLIPF